MEGLSQKGKKWERTHEHNSSVVVVGGKGVSIGGRAFRARDDDGKK